MDRRPADREKDSRYSGAMGVQPDGGSRTARVNIIAVAERAGVSPATVSRSLRGTAKVAPETRRRVIDAARELAYLPAAHMTGPDDPPPRAGVVAVAVPFITRWFFSAVTAGAVDVLRENGFDITLFPLGNADARDDFFARMPLAPGVDGLLTLCMPLTDEHTLSLRALGLPLVSVGTVIPGSPSVGIDEVSAARTAVTHLTHLRHQRIAFLAGEADDPRFEFPSSGRRLVGYQQALRAAGLEVDDRLVAVGRHGPEGGAEAMTRLLSGPVLPTAVFAEYDELAIGALWALRRAGFRVPQDMSVIGVDDHEMSALLDLTSVAQDPAAQGRQAAQLLLALLQGSDLPARTVGTAEPSDDHRAVPTVRLPTRLVLRGSAAPLPSRTSGDHVSAARCDHPVP